MINLEYHKGEVCTLRPIFCQEGYCSECSIYQNHSPRLTMATREAADPERNYTSRIEKRFDIIQGSYKS